MKTKIAWRLNTALLDRLDRACQNENRRHIAIIEQALAEYLHVPVANRALPQAPVELCGNCERGVLNEGRCGDCGWHRLTRQEQWAHDRQIRAQAKRQPKTSKPAEAA